MIRLEWCRTAALGGALVFVLLGGAAAPSAAGEVVQHELTFEATGARLERTGAGRVTVHLRGAAGRVGAVGAPALPTRLLQLEIPADRTVQRVTVEVLDEEALGRGVQVVPAMPPRAADAPAAPVVFDPEVYGKDQVYPATLARFVGRSAMRGHVLANIQVVPWRYQPARGELVLITRLRVTLETVPAPHLGLPRYRVVPEIEARFEATASRRIPNLETQVARGGGGGVAEPGPYQPTFRPTTDGSPVGYVIVTSPALQTEFQRLADWKTRKGVQAVVRTTDWIDAEYPNGVDAAERLRFFLRDAYQNWGTYFVLLGGDVDQVPFRYAYTPLVGGEHIPSDYYFMCLDDTWNANGNDLWGEGQNLLAEPTDDADLAAELVLGRAPVSTLEEAQIFVDKVLEYETNPPAGNGYPGSALLMAERLFDTVDGAELAESASGLLPEWFKQVKLYEEFSSWPGSLPLNVSAAVDSLNNGFGFVLHVGHGFRNTMSVGEFPLTNGHIDNMINGARQPFVMGVNCSSASIDFNAIGERFLKNPAGGGVAYYGTSRFAFVSPSETVQQAWLSMAFEDSVRSFGDLCTFARLPLLPTSVLNTADRWMVQALTLLGDPECDFYTAGVAPLAVSHPSTYTLGSGAFTVSVLSGGDQVEGATVTLWKGGEAYVTGQTDGGGSVSLVLGAETPGDMTVTVHKSYYRPYDTTVSVAAATGPYAFVQSVTLDDDAGAPSSGDGDGRADAGETVEIQVIVKNAGAQSITGASGTVSADDPGGYLSWITDQSTYGTIAPGGALAGQVPFAVTIDADAPDAYQPALTLVVTANEGTWSDTVTLPVHRHYLEHVQHEVDDGAGGNGVVEAGERVQYTIELRNTGQETAFDVSATLRALRRADGQVEPGVTLHDDTMSFGDILADASLVSGSPFDFELDALLDPATIDLEVTITDARAQTFVQLLDLVAPGAADSLTAFGAPTEVELHWRAPADLDVWAYDIYRSDSAGGPFARVNEYRVSSASMFVDGGLTPLSNYYYQVVAIDSSFNVGPASEVFEGITSPASAPGWPIEATQAFSSSLQFADIQGDHDVELFTASDYVYGWHHDANEIVDGDDDPRTSGVFSTLGFHPEKGFSATPAVGDVDGDGSLEVCNVAWWQAELYLWDAAGDIMPGWPKSILSDFNWASPVLADLDNDQDLEVILWAGKGGRLFAWHHDGTEVADGDNNPTTDGILRRIFGISFNYSSPAVGNLDADPAAEIVFCSNLSSQSTDPQGGIWVINDDGSNVPGWPVFTGHETAPSSITASPAIVDLDGDGSNEVVVTSERAGGLVHVLNADGTNLQGWPKVVSSFTSVRVPSPVIADLDQDGELEVIQLDRTNQLWVWRASGQLQANFPVQFAVNAVPSESTPSVGDIDDDGKLEILFGDEDRRLHAYNHDATVVSGFPIQLGGEVRSTPAIWDLDGDGLIEVAVSAWDQTVYIWDLPFEWHPELIPWPMFRHDARNTGYFGTQQQIGVALPGPAPTLSARLWPPAPNPFNPRTRLDFAVGQQAQPVKIMVYDVAGRLIRQLVNQTLPPGQHSVEWDGRTGSGRTAESGVYFYRAAIGDFVGEGKLTLLK